MKGGAGISTARRGAAAGREAAEAALAAAGLGRADGAFLFATSDLAAELEPLLASAADVLGTQAVVGATALGVIGAGREEPSGVAILAFGGAEPRAVFVPDLRGREPEACADVLEALGEAPGERDLVVLLPDAAALDPAALLSVLAPALAPATLVGAGAARAGAAPSLQWSGPIVASGALAGLVLRGSTPPRIGVTQSCRPVTELLPVTRAEGHWVLELGGRPALDVYRDVARGPLAADLRRAALHLLAALPRDEAAPLAPGGYLARHVVGFSEQRRAFALPEPVARGQSIALALRDAHSAREDLRAMLGGVADGRAALGLYLDCCARGSSLFGVAGLEAAYLEQALPGVPVAGLLGSCEIGPVGGRTELLTYTGVLALLDAD